MIDGPSNRLGFGGALREQERRRVRGPLPQAPHNPADGIEFWLKRRTPLTKGERLRRALAWGALSAVAVPVAVWFVNELVPHAYNQPSLLEQFISPSDMASNSFFLKSLAVDAVIVGGGVTALSYGISSALNRRKK